MEKYKHKYKYKIHDIVFTRDSETIIIREAYYDEGDGAHRYEGVVPDTGASRHYSEEECYNNVGDYEKDLLDEVKEEVKNRKEELENAEKILKELLNNN